MMIGMKMMMLIIKEIYFYVVCGNEILFSKFHKRDLFYMNVKQGREEESLKTSNLKIIKSKNIWNSRHIY